MDDTDERNKFGEHEHSKRLKQSHGASVEHQDEVMLVT